MFNPLTIWQNKKAQRQQDMKSRIVNNRAAMYDVLNEWTKTAKGCPELLMEKCKGPACERFQEFKNIDEKGNESSYWRCVYNQIPLLLIELIRDVNLLRKELVKQRESEHE